MTYPTKYTAPQFSTTWQYDPGPVDQPTHAFPNIMVDGVLPAQLGKVTSIDLDFSWTYGIGNTIVQSTSVTDLDAHAVNTNVAIDMFFDTDSTKAQDSEEAKYEVMVWFAQIGTSSKAIGNPTGTQRTINGTTL
jgi:Glycosyl hydrolase family 12